MRRTIIRGLFVLAACLQSSANAALATIRVGSKVTNMRIVAAARLPTNPRPVAVEEYCSGYAIARPRTLGGRLTKRSGWIVTSETKLGSYDAKTFVRALEGATSATCFHLNGNLAIFDGTNLKALAYWQRSAKEPLTKGDNEIEDSLGAAEQIDPARIRLLFGLPSGPFADVVLRDGVFIEAIRAADPVCGGAAIVPNVFGKDIRRARKKLRAYGWLPSRPTPDNPMFGGEELFKQGVVEVQDCSGTGYGFCGFNYRHRKGFTLSVGSMGEDYAIDGYSVHCGHSQMPIRQLSGPDVKYP